MRVKNSINNILMGLSGQVITLVIGFVVRTVFISMLGKTYLGVSGLFSNILSILSLAELGVGQAIVFSLYKPIANHDENKICALMKLYEKFYRIIFAVVLVVGLCVLPFLGFIIQDIDSIPYLRLIYVIYVINSASTYLFSYKSAFITANQQNYIVTRITSVFAVLVAGCQIAILYLTKNFIAYLLVQILLTLLQNAYISHKANRLHPFLKKKKTEPLEQQEKTSIKNNVKALVIYKLGTLSLNSTDNIIISAFVGIATVGVYSNYLLLSTSITGFLSTVFSNLTASIGNLNASETKEKKLFMFDVINLATYWMYGVVSICLFVFMTPFIQIWLGGEYLLGVHESFIIALNIFIGGMLFAPFNYRQTMGLFVYGKMRPVISAVINIVVSVVLGKYFGLAGVLWGTAVARLTTNVWFDPYIVFKKGLGISPVKYFLDYLMKTALLLAVGFAASVISSLIPTTNFLWLILNACAVFAFVNLVFFLLYRRTKEFQYLYGVLDQYALAKVRRLLKHGKAD